MNAFLFLLFFFNDTATTEIYTLSLHDALPILTKCKRPQNPQDLLEHRLLAFSFWTPTKTRKPVAYVPVSLRSEEHTSELQSHLNIVCRLLLEKKKKENKTIIIQPAYHIRTPQP